MKKNKGVTLIALVITIIVLLILAGVVLSMIMGDSGIFGKANSANNKTKESQALEDVRLLILEAQTEAASQNKSATLADVMDQINKSSNTYLVKTPSGETSKFLNDSSCTTILPEGTTEIYVTNIDYGCEVKVNSGLKAELTNVTVDIQEPKEPEQYTISYNLTGGSGSIEDQTKIENEILTLSEIKPQKVGYSFQGWALSEEGDVVYVASGNYTANEAAILYAKWSPLTISVINPAMTSNTSPSGTASCGNYADSTHMAYNAFKSSSGDYWLCQNINGGSLSSAWWAYDFGQVVYMDRIEGTVLAYCDRNAANPVTFDIYVSTDGTNYTKHSSKNVSMVVANHVNSGSFSVDLKGDYRAVKIVFTSSYVATSSYPSTAYGSLYNVEIYGNKD